MNKTILFFLVGSAICINLVIMYGGQPRMTYGDKRILSKQNACDLIMDRVTYSPSTIVQSDSAVICSCIVDYSELKFHCYDFE